VPVRVIVFDLGHTLWDIGDAGDALAGAYERARETLVIALGPGRVPPAAALQSAVTDALRDSAETYFMQSPNLEQPPTHTWVDAGCRSFGLVLTPALLREITPPLFATETERLICHDGTRDAVRRLADRGYRVGCITNTLADGAAIRRMLQLHGFGDIMQSVVVSSEEGWRKPHPSLFHKSLRELRATAAEAVFVGDSPWHDIAGAAAVGMHTVLTRQYVSRPDVVGTTPDAIIHHVRELADVVSRLDSPAPRTRAGG